MSSQSRYDGWWQASDGNWYPPEQHPNNRPNVPSPPLQPSSAVPATTTPNPGVVNSSGLRTVPLDARLGSYLLNSALMIVTLWIGWLVWATVLAAQGTGQTPAEQLLGHQVIDEHTLQPLGFARMFFMRGLLVALIMWFAGLLLVVPAIALLLMPFFRQDKATIWEVVSGSRVVYSQ